MTPAQPRPIERHTFTDHDAATRALEREHEVLANMQGADSARIDTLVGEVGKLAGNVEHVRGDVSTVKTGVEKLNGALALLMQHDIHMVQDRARVDALHRRQDQADERLKTIEVAMPGLMETRGAVLKAAGLVVVAVLAAVLGLVLVKG